jgi:hypothetical protein
MPLKVDRTLAGSSMMPAEQEPKHEDNDEHEHSIGHPA